MFKKYRSTTNLQRGIGRVWAMILVASLVINLIAPILPSPAYAAGGDFVSTNFAAAGPYSYDHTSGGGAFDDGTKNKATGVVESLEGSDFACGDVVTFLTAIKIVANPVHANQTAEFSYKFLGDSTGQSGAAITDIIDVRVNRGAVAYGAGPDGTDSGMKDDGGSVATLVSESVQGTLFTSGSLLLGTVRVTDLEAGEQVIVRIDVRLSCNPNDSPTGNLQGQLDSGKVVSPVYETINTGQQTIPFLQIGDLLGAGEPVMRISKTVTTAGGTCPGVETLTVTAGDTVKYCYTVTNPGTAPLYNASLVDDNGTPDNTADDFAITIGSLSAGASTSRSALVTLTAAGTITNIATATGDNNQTGQKKVFYTDQDSATVVVLGPPNSAPSAVNDSAFVAEDGSVTIQPAANDTDPDGNLDPSTVTVVDAPMHGTLVPNGDGSFTYIPNPDYSGPDSFTYQVCDSGEPALCDTATAYVDVTPANDAPVAMDDQATTLEDSPATVIVLANDSDVDGNPLSISEYTQPANGTVSLNADGTFTYTPNASYFGPDSFTYTISDGNGGFDTATVNLTVNPVNDPPTANLDSAATNEDTPLVIDLLDNDSDPEGNLDPSTLTILGALAGENGTLSFMNFTIQVNGDGTVTFTPKADFHSYNDEPVAFEYQICDADGLCSTAMVYVTVYAVNDAPLANPDSATTPEETAVTFPVLENDYDADGDELAVGNYTQPANGSVSLNDDGTFTYTPDENYSGTDSFTYEVCEVKAQGEAIECATATVNLTISPVNDAPLAAPDAYTTDEDISLVVPASGLLANDSDVDGDMLSVFEYTQPANGSVSVNADGSFTYTPNANYYGPDSFTYTVSDGNGGLVLATVNLTVNPVNDAPVANDDAATTMEDSAVVIGVLPNDTDADMDPLSISSYSQPANGAVTLNEDGTFTYTPNANWYGTDSFTYTVCDTSGACDEAQVIVEVLPVNDPPTANDDSATVSEDDAVTIDVADNDSDVDGNLVPSSATLVSGPAYGALVNNGDGTFSYTPYENYHGADSFVYQICDDLNECATATATITVTPVNDTPVALDDSLSATEDASLLINPANLLGNDSDIDGDTLSISSVGGPSNGTLTANGDGTYTYTPNANYCGSDSFSYTISDGLITASATVTLNVACVNDAPTAADNSYATLEDTPLTVDAIGVLDNDSDIDGDTLVVDTYTQPANGTVVLNPDGSFTYIPSANYHNDTAGAADMFTYTLTDGNGGYAEATVYIQVTAVNDAPEAVDDNLEAIEDESLTIYTDPTLTGGLFANDSDVDGDGLAISEFTQPQHGTLEANGDGTFTYTPDENYCGQDSFTYTVTDGQDGFATATVNLSVLCVNDAPTATDDNLNGNLNSSYFIEDAPQTFSASDLLSNDSDIDGDSLAIDGFTQPAHGTLLDNGDGTYTYTPNANFFGEDSFTYTISDGQGGYATATVTINVASANDAPLAQDDAYSTVQNTTLTVSAPGVMVNDSDPVEANPISVSGYDQTGTFGGTITMNPNGSFTYTPAKDFAGYDTFTYTISDGNGGYDTATVTITVAAKNGRSIAVSWGDWTRTGQQLSGTFNVQNMSGGGYAVQLTGFEILAQYKTSGGNIWTDVAISGCSFNPAAPTLLQTTATIGFSGCTLSDPIPAGATVRVTAVVSIFGHKDQGKLKQLFLSRLSK